MISNVTNSILNSLIFYGFFYANTVLFIGIHKRKLVLPSLHIAFLPLFMVFVWTDICQRDLGISYYYEWWERQFNIDFQGVVYSLITSFIYSIIFLLTDMYYSISITIFTYNLFRIWWYQCDPSAVIFIGGQPFFNYIE